MSDDTGHVNDRGCTSRVYHGRLYPYGSVLGVHVRRFKGSAEGVCHGRAGLHRV